MDFGLDKKHEMAIIMIIPPIIIFIIAQKYIVEGTSGSIK